MNPAATPTIMSSVKSSRASSALFSPNFLAMMALPPEASMTPTAMTRFRTGYTMLAEDRAFVPSSLEMKIPSTIVYKDMNTIITIVGAAKRSSEKNLKSFAIEFDI